MSTGYDTERLIRALRTIRGLDIEGKTDSKTGQIKDAEDAINRPIKLSSADLVHAIEIANGRDLAVNDPQIEKIISGEAKTIRQDLIDDLHRFVFRTMLGRALRFTTDEPMSPYEDTIDALASHDTKDVYVGRYLVYHGSYKTPGSLAIRAMEIEEDENYILGVKDYILDHLTKVTNPDYRRQSIGCMHFYNNNPSILLRSEDNRVGTSLFIAREVMRRPLTRRVEEFSGKMFGLTSGNNSFFRRMSAVRREESLETLIKESGVYTPAELINAEKEDKKKIKTVQTSGDISRIEAASDGRCIP